MAKQGASVGLNGFSHVGDGYFETRNYVGTIPAGIYECNTSMGKAYLKPMELTTDDLFVLPDSQSAEVLEHIQIFFSNAEKYQAFGVVHKTSILLEGAPGCGKTAIAEIVAKNFVASGGVVFYTPYSSDLTHCLRGLRLSEPDRPVIVLLEDIDGQSEDSLIDLLDGEEQIDHVCFLSTTNHLEKISDRMKRPGRMDDIITISCPTAHHREFYVRKKCPQLHDDQVRRIVNATHDFSFASLKLLLEMTQIRGIALETAVARLITD